MPMFDGTGPQGMGSMTGRGMGKCNPQIVNQKPFLPHNNNYSVPCGLGRGLGPCFGRGRGFGLFGLGRGVRSGRGSF